MIYSPLFANPDCGMDFIHSKHSVTQSDEMLARSSKHPTTTSEPYSHDATHLDSETFSLSSSLLKNITSC